MRVVHQIKHSQPISSFAITQDMSHLAVGLADASFTLKKNKSKEKKIEKITEDARLFNVETKEEALSYKYFFRGIYQKMPEYIDKKVDLVASQKLKNYDKFLR